MDIKKLNEIVEGVETSFYPLTHEDAVVDNNGTTVGSKIDNLNTKYAVSYNAMINTQGIVDDLNDNTYRKSETYNRTELDHMITTPGIVYKDYDTYALMLAETDHPNGAIYRVANWDGTQNVIADKYTEYSYDGSNYKVMAVRDHGIATAEDFDNPDSTKRAKLSSVGAVADVFGSYNQNENFYHLEQDASGNTIWGVQSDGNIYYGSGVPKQTKDLVKTVYDGVSLKLDLLDTEQTIINEDVKNKVDKEEDKSLINKDYASSIYYLPTPELLEAKLDNENRILEAICKDGTKLLPAGVNLNNNIIKPENISEFIGVWIDANKNIIMAIKSNADIYFGYGVPSQIKQYIDEQIASIPEPENYDKVINFLGDLIQEDNTLQQLLQEIWDNKVDGTYVNIPEYLHVTTDKDGFVLGGRKLNGSKFESVGIETPNININGSTIKNIQDVENRIEIKLDKEGKIISYIDQYGTINESSVNVEDAKIKSAEIDNLNVDSININSEDGKSELANELTPYIHIEEDYTDDDVKRVLSDEYLKEEAANCKAVSLYESTYNDNSTKKKHDSVNIMFLSDIHGSVANMANVTTIVNKLKLNGCSINDVYFGGDLSSSMFSDNSFNRYWDANVDPSFMFAIGNHDTWISLTDYDPEAGDIQTNSFYVKNPTAIYNQYYKGRIENWGVQYQEGKNYFYKDYGCNITVDGQQVFVKTVRIIVLDAIHIPDTQVGSEQYNWLVNVLEDARTAGYNGESLHVICIEHYCPYALTKIDSKWTMIDKNYTNTNPNSWEGGGVNFRNAVDEFIENGGTFVTWLVGHTHCDLVGYVEGTHNHKQLVFVTALASNNNRSADNVAVTGTKSQNCMTYISLDVDKKLLRMHRIGRNISRYGQKRDYITLDYGTQRLITES